MTAEVNAAIEGALAGGADEIIVNDSHDGMRNILPDKLLADPAVRFISGQDKPLGMVQGVDRDFDPFCPKVIAFNGTVLPNDLASRCIVSTLWRKLSREKAELVP